MPVLVSAPSDLLRQFRHGDLDAFRDAIPSGTKRESTAGSL